MEITEDWLNNEIANLEQVEAQAQAQAHMANGALQTLYQIREYLRATEAPALSEDELKELVGAEEIGEPVPLKEQF